MRAALKQENETRSGRLAEAVLWQGREDRRLRLGLPEHAPDGPEAARQHAAPGRFARVADPAGDRVDMATAGHQGESTEQEPNLYLQLRQSH